MVAAPTPYTESRATLLARSGPDRAGVLHWPACPTNGLPPVGSWREDTGVALWPSGATAARALPGSDLDVLLLHSGRDRAGRGDIAAIAERVWYPVWDAGVRLDHSVRTLAEARKTAAEDARPRPARRPTRRR